jgi:hypothetical protein
LIENTRETLKYIIKKLKVKSVFLKKLPAVAPWFTKIENRDHFWIQRPKKHWGTRFFFSINNVKQNIDFIPFFSPNQPLWTPGLHPILRTVKFVFRWAAGFCITRTFLLILIKTQKKFQPKSAKKFFLCSIEMSK